MIDDIVKVLEAENKRRIQWEKDFTALLRTYLGAVSMPVEIQGQMTIQTGIEQAMSERLLTEAAPKPSETLTSSSRRVRSRVVTRAKDSPPGPPPSGGIVDYVPESETSIDGVEETIEEEELSDDVITKACKICRKSHRVDRICGG